MDANVKQETQTAKLSEREQSILNLSNEFKRNLSVLLGTENGRLDIWITVPDTEYTEWMAKTRIKDDGVWIGITDDSLPF